jgi:translation initiation factor 1
VADPKSSSPFASLASLRAALPAGPTPAVPTPCAPAARLGGKIVLSKERKGHGGKTVTRVRGLEPRGAALAALASEMKRALGCGGSVDGDDVLLAGEQLDRAAAWLRARGATKIVVGT